MVAEVAQNQRCGMSAQRLPANSEYYGKLESIAITFHPKFFTEVAAALVEKYGSGSVTTKTLQNRMGASFENKIYSWRRNDATLEARRYTSKLDTSSVTYATDFSLQEFARRRGTSVKEKSKDM
jgi:hypothetical protein